MSNCKFRDKCDNCNEMKVLKGYSGQCLCEECINQIKKEDIKDEQESTSS